MKIKVTLSGKEFVRFSVFDAFHRKKIWLRPALFAAILGAAAAVCFVMRQRQGAVLLGGVLLGVAVVLPAAYFLSFFLSLRGQVRKDGLDRPKYVYTLELHDSSGGIEVDNGREHAVYPWDQVFHAYRRPSAAYLYITPQRAFLIPYGCVEGGADGLWALIERRIPEGRRTP